MSTKQPKDENLDEIEEKSDADTKVCARCKESLSYDQFDIIDRRKDKSPLYSRMCKECVKEHIPREIMRDGRVKGCLKLNSTTFDKIFKVDEPIVTSMLASSKSGKTTLLYNLVETVHKYYDIILFFSVNSKAKIYKNFKQKRLLLIQDFDERIIYALHHLNQECDSKFKFFVIMDDIIEVKYSKVVAQLFSTFRNMNFSSLHSVQYKIYMNPNARAQCHDIFFGKQNNMHQIKKTVEEYFLGFKKLMEAIPPEFAAQSEKIDWLSVWYQKNTEDHNFIVFDVLNDELYKIKSQILIK